MTNYAKSRIIAFIRSHGCPCRLMADGRIKVASQFSSPDHKGFSWEVTTIACSSADARDFLGY